MATVEMPKFSFEYEISLKDVLISLGMGVAFDDPEHGLADFSKINPTMHLYISKVKHKTFVQVDEKGTEAIGTVSVATAPEPPEEELILVVSPSRGRGRGSRDLCRQYAEQGQ